MARHDTGQPQQREGHQHEQGDDHHHDRDQDDDGGDSADRVPDQAHCRADVAPVDKRVDGSAEGLEEPHVEHPEDGQQPEQHAEDRDHDPRRAPRQHQHQRHEDEHLDRKPQERPRVEGLERARSRQPEPDEQRREPGEHARQPVSAPHAATAIEGSFRTRPVPPQPAHLPCERLGQQSQHDQEHRSVQRSGQHSGCGHRQCDTRRRGHHLAPVARWRRLTQPRQRSGRSQQQVARSPGREHPRPHRRRHVDAEHQDQERVDLHVEPGAQLRDRSGAARHLAVHAVEQQRHDGQRHQHRDRRRAPERVGGERGHAADEDGSRHRDPVGRSEPLGLGADHRERDAARQAGEPAGEAQPDGAGEGAEHPHLAEQHSRRTALNRRHPCSVHQGQQVIET